MKSPESSQQEEPDKIQEDSSPPTETKNNWHPPLPKNNEEYGKKEYWDDRFTNEREFEWLVSYRDVASQLKPFLRTDNRILVVGCGNSSFSADLYDDGYQRICSLDYSQVVIDAMRKRNEGKRPEMEWVVRFAKQYGIDESSCRPLSLLILSSHVHHCPTGHGHDGYE